MPSIIVPAGDRQAVTAALESALGGRAPRRVTGMVAGSIAILAAAGGPSTIVAIDPVADGAAEVRSIVSTAEPIAEEALALARALAVTLEHRRSLDGGHQIVLTFSLPDPGHDPAGPTGDDRLADLDWLRATLALETAEVQRLAAQLSDANARLREFNRLVAHDLKNPLVAIARAAEILTAHGTTRTDSDRRCIDLIDRAAQQATGMIDDILAYAQAGELGTGPVPLDKILSEIAEELRPGMDAASATVEVPMPLPEVMGNPTALRQVVRNLFANALAYRHPDRSPVITVTTDDSVPGYWRIVIGDNGIGIPPEQREAVFQPGVRLLACEAAGTGYGLTAVRALVERHGGRIHADDSPGGVGTAIVIDLPRDS
jgi:signal transduction histidine kinase